MVQRSRLLEPLGYVPPAEFEKAYQTVRRLQPAWRFSRNELSGKPGAVHCTRVMIHAATHQECTCAVSRTCRTPAGMNWTVRLSATAVTGW